MYIVYIVDEYIMLLIFYKRWLVRKMLQQNIILLYKMVRFTVFLVNDNHDLNVYCIVIIIVLFHRH